MPEPTKPSTVEPATDPSVVTPKVAPLEDHPEFHGAEAPIDKTAKSIKVEIVIAAGTWRPVKGNAADVVGKAKQQVDINKLTFDQPIAHPDVAESLRLVRLQAGIATVRSEKTGAMHDFSVSELFDPRVANRIAEQQDAAKPVPSAPPPPTGVAAKHA